MPKRIFILFLMSFFLILSFWLQVSAQNRFKGWEVYTCFKDVKSVDYKDNQVWAASTGGMFKFDANSNPPVIIKFTNLDGLRSTQLNAILVDNSSSVWAGAYDGSISFYNPGSNLWRYVTDIQTSNESDKRVNHIFQYGNFLFIATQFGIIKFDIPHFQMADQPYIFLGPQISHQAVNKLLVVNDTIWAATVAGIAFADIRSYLPIQSNWSNFTRGNSVLQSNHINTTAFFNGKVYLGTDSGLVYYWNNTLYNYLPRYNGQPIIDPIKDITVSNSTMYFASATGNIFKVEQSNLDEAQLFASGIQANSLKAGRNDSLYIGTANYGVLKNNLNNKILPNGPNSNLFIYAETDANGNVWGTAGGSGEGIYRYDGTGWKNYTPEFFPQMLNGDYRQLYFSTNTGYMWASGFGEGLLRIKGDNVFLYNDQNSCLSPFGVNFTLVEGVKEGHDGHLWVINRAPSDGMSIVDFTNNPDCIKYPPPPGASTTMKFMAIDNYNTKWMTVHPDGDQGRSICYFNESANSQRNIPSGNLGSDITSVNEITVDKNGEIWIATDNGIAIIADPYQIIQTPNSVPDVFKMRIIENGISTPLTENVNTVRADALNNKWIATKSIGLIYVSPDGSTILAKYNTTNSPLPSNEVSSVAIDSKSGKVYFGTQRGLISFQTVAAEPLSDCNKIISGPNPYIIPNDNLLKIDGLVEGSTVKILTVSGVLVTEFESPGGRVANWNGKDMNGNYVASGIYVIAGFNKDASKVCTGKVAVIRK